MSLMTKFNNICNLFHEMLIIILINIIRLFEDQTRWKMSKHSTKCLEDNKDSLILILTLLPSKNKVFIQKINSQLARASANTTHGQICP